MTSSRTWRIDGMYGVYALETLYGWQGRHGPWRPPITEAKKAGVPHVAHPLVRVHPVTGGRSLFIRPAVISHIEGLAAAESAAPPRPVLQIPAATKTMGGFSPAGSGRSWR